MQALAGKNVMVIGGSRGLGRVIVEAARAEGAQVLAVAREEKALDRLTAEVPGVRTLAIDATGKQAAEQVFGTLPPDVLVICAGAIPPGAPLHQETWDEFSVNWETDVKASFLFCKAAASAQAQTDDSPGSRSDGKACTGPPGRRCTI